LLQLRTQRL